MWMWGVGEGGKGGWGGWRRGGGRGGGGGGGGAGGGGGGAGGKRRARRVRRSPGKRHPPQRHADCRKAQDGRADPEFVRRRQENSRRRRHLRAQIRAGKAARLIVRGRKAASTAGAGEAATIALMRVPWSTCAAGQAKIRAGKGSDGHLFQRAQGVALVPQLGICHVPHRTVLLSQLVACSAWGRGPVSARRANRR